jgi:hypothetical protein
VGGKVRGTFWGGAFLQRKPFEFLAGSKESLNQSGGAEKVAMAGEETKDGEQDLVGVTGSMVESSSEQ